MHCSGIRWVRMDLAIDRRELKILQISARLSISKQTTIISSFSVTIIARELKMTVSHFHVGSVKQLICMVLIVKKPRSFKLSEHMTRRTAITLLHMMFTLGEMDFPKVYS